MPAGDAAQTDAAAGEEEEAGDGADSQQPAGEDFWDKDESELKSPEQKQPAEGWITSPPSRASSSASKQHSSV